MKKAKAAQEVHLVQVLDFASLLVLCVATKYSTAVKSNRGVPHAKPVRADRLSCFIWTFLNLLEIKRINHPFEFAQFLP